jgi:hypothetical protein
LAIFDDMGKCGMPLKTLTHKEIENKLIARDMER